MNLGDKLGDAEVHITLDAVQCGVNFHAVRSPEYKGGPEDVILPNVEKGFGFPEAIEFMESGASFLKVSESPS